MIEGCRGGQSGDLRHGAEGQREKRVKKAVVGGWEWQSPLTAGVCRRRVFDHASRRPRFPPQSGLVWLGLGPS